ncbi:hypothetical protein [Parasitella parasitica]|uniref:Uncharacterized protein n=1 Tax=Parasitella parasitica TaxID=35722 RepID=A0A0B7NJW7_9FUNG|nr:hypothetical protein [Parasitella parasitica]
MFDGLHSESDAWINCVKVVLGLLEDSFLSGTTPTTKISFNQDWVKNNGSTETLSTPGSPSNQSIKRKRSFTETAQDRKLQKLSSSLANDIARSLSVSMDDVDMTASSQPHSFTVHKKPLDEENPMPTLRRISLSGTLNPPLTSTTEQWLKLQARNHNRPFSEFNAIFTDKQNSLRNELELLQKPGQSFESLRDHLSTVLRLADELSGDHTLPFVKIFPEWTLYDSRINKLATYVQSIEDMSCSINNTIPQSDDLLQDIKGLQSLLDTKMALYGDALIQNGLEWKAMGLPVDEQLVEAAKDWFHKLCIGLVDALDAECKKVQSLVNDMGELVEMPLGESLMASILAGLEFIAEASTFIGYTSQKLIYDCRVLAAIYGQWSTENLDHINEKSTDANMQKSLATNARRIDIRYMQIMDNMTLVLSALYTLSDLDMLHRDIAHLSSSITCAENLTSVLVELTVRAVGAIEMERKNTSSTRKIAGNIMTHPQISFIYMGESLLSFADRIVELAGREWTDGARVKTLHAYLEDLENSLCD